MSDLRGNLKEIADKIRRAAERAGRSPSEIKLIAVSKTHPVELLRTAAAGGAQIFGENKVQEAAEKIDALGSDFAEWHLIGHLQSNKARKAVKIFDVIETVDSIELAERLERICIEENRESLKIFVQIDLAREATKNGIAEADLPALTARLKNMERVKLAGFMTIPPYSETAETTRPFFRRLREIRDRFLPSGELSMGMSHDFELAIEEGATCVRVGTAIFGTRGNIKN